MNPLLEDLIDRSLLGLFLAQASKIFNCLYVDVRTTLAAAVT